MAKKKIVKKVKAKGKQWYVITSPRLFGEKELGKTSTSEPKKLVGRMVTVSLVDLINDFKKYYVKMRFRIVKVEGEFARTEFAGSEVMRDYLSRMVLKRTRRVDTVQDLKTKDGVGIRVKGVAILPRRVKSSIQLKVRNEIKAVLKERVGSQTIDKLIESVITDEMKFRVLREARKIYPIRNFEIRKTEIVSK